MQTKFIPQMDALKSTDWHKPQVAKNDTNKIILMVLCALMFAVVFIPWFCLGIKAGDIGSVKLRAFGFHTWYGVAGGVLALVGIVGALYKHYSLTLCASALALVIGLFTLNNYPTARLNIKLSKEVEAQFEKMNLMQQAMMLEDYDSDSDLASFALAVNEIKSLPDFKVPGPLVQGISLVFDLVDQRFVYKLLKENGLDKDVMEEIGGFRVLNHRLGAILFLVFSFFAAIMSYLAITGCCIFGKKNL